MIDRRHIEFSPEDVMDALALAPAAGRAIGLPDGRVLDVHFDPALEVVTFFYGSAVASRGMVLSAEAVGALLMSYLVRSNVPLPRSAKKSIKISPSSVSVICESELGRPSRARRPEAARAIRQTSLAASAR